MRYRRISFKVAVRVWPFSLRVRLATLKGGMMDPLAHFHPTWRVGHLEVAKATAEAKHLEALEAEVAELRSAHPSAPPRPRPRPTSGARRAT